MNFKLYYKYVLPFVTIHERDKKTASQTPHYYVATPSERQ